MSFFSKFVGAGVVGPVAGVVGAIANPSSIIFGLLASIALFVVSFPVVIPDLLLMLFLGSIAATLPAILISEASNNPFMTGLTIISAGSMGFGLLICASLFPAGIAAALTWGLYGVVIGVVLETINSIIENNANLEEIIAHPLQAGHQPDGSYFNQDQIQRRLELNEKGAYTVGFAEHTPIGQGLFFGFAAANAFAREPGRPPLYDLGMGGSRDMVTLADFGTLNVAPLVKKPSHSFG